MQSPLQATQQVNNAGKKKLTAVTISANGRRRQFFVELEHDSRGAAILPQHALDKLLSKFGLRRGETYTVG